MTNSAEDELRRLLVHATDGYFQRVNEHVERLSGLAASGQAPTPEDVSNLRNAVDHLHRTVGVAARTGTAAPDLEPVNLNELLGEVLETSFSIEDRDRIVEWVPTDALVVTTDRVGVAQILIQFLRNAVAYSKGSVRLTLQK